MDYTLLGIVAGTLTTAGYIPQALKIWKTKSSHDISSIMFAMLGTGNFLWLIYGLNLNSFPIIAANAISFVLVLIILAMKLKYK